jgi:hypothetical protein
VRPYLEKNLSPKKRVGGVAQGVGPEFNRTTTDPIPPLGIYLKE